MIGVVALIAVNNMTQVMQIAQAETGNGGIRFTLQSQMYAK